mgnify:CR=1 FL=1
MKKKKFDEADRIEQERKGEKNTMIYKEGGQIEEISGTNL